MTPATTARGVGANSDLWGMSEKSRADTVVLFKRAAVHSDATMVEEVACGFTADS
ncbi:MAG: hypothetical protein ABI345_05875 [Jatrophihabitans sp.]